MVRQRERAAQPQVIPIPNRQKTRPREPKTSDESQKTSQTTRPPKEPARKQEQHGPLLLANAVLRQPGPAPKKPTERGPRDQPPHVPGTEAEEDR